MKKILIFSTAYLPFVGGAELAVKEITDRLSPAEFSFDLVTLNIDRKQKAEERIGNIHVVRLSCPKLLFPFLAARTAARLQRGSPYDAIWSIMASYGGLAGLFFKRRFPKVPFILTLQEGDSLSHIYRRAVFIWPFFKQIFTNADRITAISHYLGDWARRMGFRGEVEIIPNGVDVEKFQITNSVPLRHLSQGDKSQTNSKLPKEEIRKKLGWGESDTILVTTSRLVEKNAVGDIIAALEYLPENVKLLVIGTGPLEKSLKSKVKSQKLETHVRFLGFIPHEQLPPYLWASDIFVRPSLSEGMGSSFIEAMAAGLPAIATPVGGIPDFLKDGETGLFCEVSSPKSIAQKVEKLMKDAESRGYIVQNAFTMVRETYDWASIASAMKLVLTNAGEGVS